MPYDPSLPVQLACDASPVGTADILSHIVDGEEHGRVTKWTQYIGVLTLAGTARVVEENHGKRF